MSSDNFILYENIITQDIKENMEDLNSNNDLNIFKEEFIHNFEKSANLDFKSRTNSNEIKLNIFDKTGEKSNQIRNNNDFPSILDSDKLDIIKINSHINENQKIDCSSNLLGRKRYNEKFEIFNNGRSFQNTRKLINHILEQGENKKYVNEENSVNNKIEKDEKNEKNEKTINEYIRKDNLRKKIKSRFIKTLVKLVNNRLKLAGSKKKFKPLSQKFIINVNRKKNKAILDLSFKEIFSRNLFEGKETDLSVQKNLNNNISVLKYLKKNKKVSEKSNYNSFKDMKFHEIFNEYLNSEEFEIVIKKLIKNPNVREEYIIKYVIYSYNLIKFFSN